MPYKTWTPRRHAARAERIEALRELASTPDGATPGHCRVAGCTKHPESAFGAFCKDHGNHYRRHGHPLRGTYSGPQANPQRRAALRWLQANREAELVQITVQRVLEAYNEAGPALPLNNHAGARTEAKARAVFARLRDNGTDPLLVIAAVLGIAMTVAADPEKPFPASSLREYRRTQSAKVALRLSGGKVRRWPRGERRLSEFTSETARPLPQELRQFPHSSGRILRVLGARLEALCDWLLDDAHLSELAAYAALQPVTKASFRTPYPSYRKAKPKPRLPYDMKPTGVFAAQEKARLRRYTERAKARKAAADAKVLTPEQEAARQPLEKTLIAGQWIETAKASNDG